MSHDERSREQSRDRQSSTPASRSQPSISPGKRTLTMSQGPRSVSVQTPVQMTPDPAAGEKRMVHAALTEQWMDVSMRPDLHSAPVQMQGRSEQSARNVQRLAAQGVSSGATVLPHLDQIQRSFGHHEVSGIKAHVGGPAAQASEAMGAQAYATGDDVAFSGTPDLHTAAHEAAHIVQQRGGVQLKGGVGAPGDRYEQHADAVADRVVQGRSAADLLDHINPTTTPAATPAASGSAGVQQNVVQMDIKSDLRSAMKGWGTDEDAIYDRLRRATLPELKAVVADAALMAELRGDLSHGEMTRVLDLVRAPLPDKLRLAMEGWGTDEEYIHRSLATATAAELQAVANDATLVNQLEGELSGEELRSVFNRLNLPLSRKLEYAIRGWGTDENYVFNSVQTAPIAEVMAVARDTGLVSRIDGDFSGAELNRWRGMLARRIYVDGGDANLAFSMCMGSEARRNARLAWIGDLTVQRAVLDFVILNSTGGNAVIQAFQSYWGVATTTAAGATSWPPATITHIHIQMKLLPDQDTRSGVWRELQLTSDPDLISRAAWNGRAFIVGSRASTASTMPAGHGTKLSAAAAAGDTTLQVTEPARFAVGDTIALDRQGRNRDAGVITAIAGSQYTIDTALTHAHRVNEDVTPDDDTATRSVNWLSATVRHEIAHAVETELGGVTGFTVGLGGWWTGNSFDTWAAAMGSPWTTSDGSAISDADKAEIKNTIDDAVKNRKGSLFTLGLPPTHAIEKYKAKQVPVIVAAEACLSAGDGFYRNANNIYAASGKRFSVSWWYKKYMYHNEDVVSQRVADYGLYAPAEFFAEAYTVYYEEAGKPGVTEADHGRLIRNGTWRSWIRDNIHNRGQAPAGTGAGGGSSPGSEGGAVASGASYGRAAGNPGP
jgi:hypothetical protein